MRPLQFDFLVLGTGIAGLSFALDACKHGSVAIVTKRGASDSNTNRAQGGIAAVMGSDDSFAEHVDNTMVAGDGLNHRDIVEMIVEEGPGAIARLREIGVAFADDLAREGGHTKRRVLHATDITGREIQRALLERVLTQPNVTLFEDHVAIDLIRRRKTDAGRGESGAGAAPDRILGAYVFDEKADVVRAFGARVVALATGGAGKVYLYTSNPDVATGDGVAMAFRARAKVANMEFFQFHPTCLYHPRAKSFLVSEALRGEGGILRRLDGTPFMDAVHPMGSLAPRDVVARAIDMELKRTGDDHVVLDLTHLDGDYMQDRFPTILGTVREFGIDFRTTPLPVVPAAHYQCGGVVTDAWGRTSVAGLYAVGECAHTGLHGANRLASNSLLEGAVMGARAARAAIEELPDATVPTGIAAWASGYARPGDQQVVVTHSWEEIRRTMWNYVGIVRSNERLERARRRVSMLESEILEDWWRYHVTRNAIELRNIALVARLVIDGAMRRQESRGLHCTEDFPEKDDHNWLRDTVLWRGGH
ncbi:MAG: L-aspartate oxidase [Myxococcales bacterium]|nr:L-aspartate oxidase [Myxococcales bacterium]